MGSETAWDYRSRRHIEIGARRWVVEWWTWLPGHGGANEDCANHFLENCTEGHERAFPSAALARAFGRKHKQSALPWMAYPRMAEHVFERWNDMEGSWERVGEYEEVDGPDA